MSHFIEVIKSNPADILSSSNLKSEDSLNLVKLYLDDVIGVHRAEKNNSKSVIDEIVVDGLDANQVWWQAKMVLDNVEGDLLERIQTLKEAMEDISNDSDSDDEQGEAENEEEEGGEEEEEEEGVDEKIYTDGEEEEKEVSPVENNADVYEEEEEEEEDSVNEEENTFKDAHENVGHTSQSHQDEPNEDKYGVNDQFFDIEEFNKQTLAADNGEDLSNEDEEGIDYFADVPSEDDEEVLYYDDFFDKPVSVNDKLGRKSRKEASKSGQDEEENQDFDEEAYAEAMDSAKLDLFADDEISDGERDKDSQTAQELSTFERQQIQIQEQIAQLEKEAVADKKWALKGEVKAKDRPDDALLTEDLEFERTSKPVPVITNEVTESLEDMIRRRIQEEKFDDLQRRVISGVSSFGGKPRFELSDVKSSKSLAELYEDDYKGTPQEGTVSEELQQTHDEISDLFNNLIYKLDALSSAHFIPKPAQKSLEVKVQTAAISMEDAQPLTMSSASTLAPQEIYRVGKSNDANQISLSNGVVMSKDELTRDDKNRLRRALKRKRSKAIASKKQKPNKKSKKDDVIDTLSKAKNVTIIDKKGEKSDVKGNAKRDFKSGSTNLKL